jgi:hypothetical protein
MTGVRRPVHVVVGVVVGGGGVVGGVVSVVCQYASMTV